MRNPIYITNMCNVHVYGFMGDAGVGKSTVVTQLLHWYSTFERIKMLRVHADYGVDLSNIISAFEQKTVADGTGTIPVVLVDNVTYHEDVSSIRTFSTNIIVRVVRTDNGISKVVPSREEDASDLSLFNAGNSIRDLSTLLYLSLPVPMYQ